MNVKMQLRLFNVLFGARSMASNVCFLIVYSDLDCEVMIMMIIMIS